MTYFQDFPKIRFAIRSPAALGLAALAVAVLLAGCGSSGSSTIGINNENKADEALAKSSASSPQAGATGATATTPPSGPLSKEPTVTPPKGSPPTALVTKDIIKGTGREATSGATVTVNDVGVLYRTGKEFENTFKRKEPSTLPLSQVIQGWQQGVPGMKVGGRRELIIPPSLAYGAKGNASVPPNETLVFVIDLLGV